MGLNVHLKRCENFAQSQWRKAEYERRMDEAWERIAKNRAEDEIPDSETEIFEQQSKEIARALGLDFYGEDRLVQTIELPSQKYPDHRFKIGCFYSSYNESGIDWVLSESIGIDLHSIFNSPEEGDFQPNWRLARRLCIKAIAELTAYIEQHPYDVRPFGFSPNVSPTQDGITSEALALQKLIEIESQTNLADRNSFINSDGGFFLDEPLKVLAVLPGTAESLDRRDVPCLYIVFQHKSLDFYSQALEIVLETIEYVLEQPDVEKYCLEWSI